VPAATALIVLLLVFERGLPDGDNVRPHHTARELPPDSAPVVTRNARSSPSRVYIGDSYVHEAARRTLERAAHLMSLPECQQLLSDFVDASGQPLRRKLAELGVTAVQYLRLIIFYDGTNYGRCRESGILAFTSPDSRVVYLCGRDFLRTEQSAPDDARAVVIHEMLHSLGLGENPPSSRDITSRVRQRCRR